MMDNVASFGISDSLAVFVIPPVDEPILPKPTSVFVRPIGSNPQLDKRLSLTALSPFAVESGMRSDLCLSHPNFVLATH
ncbi:MAG TPA: hypothetical protein EYP63_02805 [Desulfotomaculum sp.]|nr:hypothetical protein [Desulfotomaculum sp.]